jgi:hypothetical protein
MKDGLKPARDKMALSLLLNINFKGTALDRISARDSTGYRFSLSTLQHGLSRQRTQTIHSSSMDDPKSEKALQGSHKIIRGHAG